jgi:hypothetical protein
MGFSRHSVKAIVPEGLISAAGIVVRRWCVFFGFLRLSLVVFGDGPVKTKATFEAFRNDEHLNG